MLHISTLGVDLAKDSFQACAWSQSRDELYNKKLNRTAFKKLLQDIPSCLVAMEACGTSNYWARYAESQGHLVKLVPPIEVSRRVTRHKNDANDARAICEVAQTLGIRSVPIKSASQQAQAASVRLLEGMKKRRHQAAVSLRSQLSEFGIVFGKGLKAVIAFESELAKGQHLSLIHI